MNFFIKPGLLALFMGAFLFSSVLVSCDDDDDEMEDMETNYTLSGTASGAAERPDPVTTTASGDLSGTYNPNTKVMNYSISWIGLSEPPAAMHFHGPAGVNEAASAVVTIAVPAGAGTTGDVSGTATLTSAQEAELLAGRWYYNIHTPTHLNGEIRGQVSATR